MNWAFFSTLIIIGALVLLYGWARKAAVSSKEIALLAALIAIAALGRVPFAAIPSVQPTTFVVMLAACVFGPQAGFIVGASAALVSNFFLGQGPWTPWQMMGWGLIGAMTAYLYQLLPGAKTKGLACLGLIWGYLFGCMQNCGFWLIFVYPLSLSTFLATWVAGLAFDTLHAVCNFLLCLFLSQPVIKILREYQERIHYHILAPVNHDTNIKQDEDG